MLGFPTIIALHSVGMAITVGLALMVTLRLYRLLTGFTEHQIPRFLTIAVWGFVLNLVTGLALFISRGPEYLGAGIFLIKMLLVAIGAAIIFWLRQRLKPTESKDTFANDGIAKRLSVVASVAMFGAVVAGRLIAYLSDLYR